MAVFILKKDLQYGQYYQSIDICLAAEEVVGEDKIIGAQDIRGV